MAAVKFINIHLRAHAVSLTARHQKTEDTILKRLVRKGDGGAYRSQNIRLNNLGF